MGNPNFFPPHTSAPPSPPPMTGYPYYSSPPRPPTHYFYNSPPPEPPTNYLYYSPPPPPPCPLYSPPPLLQCPALPPHWGPPPVVQPPYSPPDNNQHTPFTAVFVYLGGLFCLAFLAAALFCLDKRKEQVVVLVPPAACVEEHEHVSETNTKRGDQIVTVTVDDCIQEVAGASGSGPPYQAGGASGSGTFYRPGGACAACGKC